MVDIDLQDLFKPNTNDHVKFFKDKHFLYPQMTEAIKHIAQVVQLSHVNAKIVAMVGEAGVGKSAISKEVKKLLSSDSSLKHQCVYTELVSRTYGKGIYDSLLKAMDISVPASYKEEDSLNHLCRLTKKYGTRLFIIDEVQHALPHNAGAKTMEVANALKLLKDRTNVSILLVGLNSVKSLITNQFHVRNSDDKKAEKQVGRRSYATIQLRSVGLYKKSQLHQILNGFSILFADIKDKFDVSIIDLNDVEFATRMWVASEGLIGYMAPIFENALLQVKPGEQITYETLAKAYETCNTNDEESASLFAAEMGVNPFTCDEKELDQLKKVIRANQIAVSAEDAA
ncbi:AAA ATPase [Pseudoalteromonas luteoviolacea B = ATCC 29581]|nr:AAA ATPase [Pseudoalteromonas luteoviolacea B = ATCC 29581]